MFEESYMKIYKKRKERRKSEQIKRKKEKGKKRKDIQDFGQGYF